MKARIGDGTSCPSRRGGVSYWRGCAAVALLAALLAAAGSSGCSRPVAGDVDVNMDTVLAMRAEMQARTGGGDGAAAEVASADGWATLTGTFKIAGSPPARQPLPVGGDDVAICAPAGRQILDELVVVDEGSSGISNVLIYVSSKTSPDWESPDDVARRDAHLAGADGFDQKECRFLSHVFAMRSTQSVEIINSDPIGHNTNISPDRGAQKSNQSLPKLSSATYSPGGESPTPFAVTCSIHPWMRAWMITRDNPYFAVTAQDGSFEIQNIPAGVPLEFRVWQEKANFLQDVTVNGQATSWNKGKFRLTLDKGSTVNLDVTVDAAVFQ